MPLTEEKRFGDKALNGQLRQHCSIWLASLTADLKGVENAIKQLIAEDSILKMLFDLVTSVPGIGPVVAAEIILTTNDRAAGAV